MLGIDSAASEPEGRASRRAPEASQKHTEAPIPLLFLISDTGGGHRNAARAVGQALDRMYPGRYAPVLCDPLGGPDSARLLRWVTGLYGPAIRLTPWLWGAAYHVTNSRPAVALLRDRKSTRLNSGTLGTSNAVSGWKKKKK